MLQDKEKSTMTAGSNTVRVEQLGKKGKKRFGRRRPIHTCLATYVLCRNRIVEPRRFADDLWIRNSK